MEKGKKEASPKARRKKEEVSLLRVPDIATGFVW